MHYPIIDAHQHFWKYNPTRDGWITDEMNVLKRDYLPADIETIYNHNQISGSVVVQADPSENENFFLLELAAQHSFIKGVVGWIDFESEKLEEKLDHFRQFKFMKGFRQLHQGDKQRDNMLNPGFQKGLGLLKKYAYCYDLLIMPDQLDYANQLAAAFPDQRFVIDHLAKPYIKQWIISEWKIAMKKFASCQNVYCKISGMVTEANWEYWEEYDFRPYMDVILETFGTKRIMFGSDWPVCLLAGAYEDVKQIADDYFNAFSISEQADFFGTNATNFYQLE
jgi:L-fuconolactonase